MFVLRDLPHEDGTAVSASFGYHRISSLFLVRGCFQVAKRVVAAVSIYVINRLGFWNRSVERFPYGPVHAHVHLFAVFGRPNLTIAPVCRRWKPGSAPARVLLIRFDCAVVRYHHLSLESNHRFPLLRRTNRRHRSFVRACSTRAVVLACTSVRGAAPCVCVCAGASGPSAYRARDGEEGEADPSLPILGRLRTRDEAALAQVQEFCNALRGCAAEGSESP